jgi:hypothetical protein
METCNLHSGLEAIIKNIEKRMDETNNKNESDPLNFDYQRGEVDKQVWLDAVTEIKARYPKPEAPNG